MKSVRSLNPFNSVCRQARVIQPIYSIINENGGNITIKTNLNSGSSFKIELPINS